jgi:hypothetical protein
MIRTSLAVQPRRGAIFAAKAVVFAVVSLVTGLVASFGLFFLGQAILSSHHLNVTLSQPNVLRAVNSAVNEIPAAVVVRQNRPAGDLLLTLLGARDNLK